MKLILVRHGESQLNAGKVSERNDLTERGREQAKKAAKYLMDENIDQIFCSNTERCIQTLDEILKNRTEAMGISFSKLLSPRRKVENLEGLKRRIYRFIEDLKIEFERETVVIIAHQWSIRMMMFLLTGENVNVENGSVTILNINGENISKIVVNETARERD
ncbi:MAG: phosphoglycerate mutase family protein [Pedobacter sp.]|jgi:broad specificity phosphatase PhoE